MTLRRYIFLIAIIVPMSYGALMVLLDTPALPPTVGQAIPLIAYIVCLIIGGALGAVGCARLAAGQPYRLLLAATLLTFVSEFIRGVAVLADVLTNPDGNLTGLSVFFFHTGAFAVVVYGALLFVGSTRKGKDIGLLALEIDGDHSDGDSDGVQTSWESER